MPRSVFLVLMALPAIAMAQSDSSALLPRHATCWRGKPEPQCRRFWITEFSGEYSYATTHTHFQFVYPSSVQDFSRPDVSSQVLWTVGPMFNRSSTRALGATVSWGLVNDGSRFALEARQRHWTSASSGIDVSAGLLRTDVPPLPRQLDHSAYGVTAGAYGIRSDLVHINAHADLLFTGGRVRAGGTVGGGFGSYLAAGSIVVAAALGVVALFVVAGEGGG